MLTLYAYSTWFLDSEYLVYSWFRREEEGPSLTSVCISAVVLEDCNSSHNSDRESSSVCAWLAPPRKLKSVDGKDDGMLIGSLAWDESWVARRASPSAFVGRPGPFLFFSGWLSKRLAVDRWVVKV